MARSQKRNLILLVWFVPLLGSVIALISPLNPRKMVDFGSEGSLLDFRLIHFPDSYSETAHLEGAFVAAGIPTFVQNRYIGDLLPGPQLPWYNDRRSFIPAEYIEEAEQIVRAVRLDHGFEESSVSWQQTVRLVAETLIFGWFVPGDRNRPPDNKSFNTDTSDAGAG